VAALHTHFPVAIRPGPPLSVRVDPDQIEQLLINLLRNAVEAMEGRGGGIELRWSTADGKLRLFVDDGGPGLPPTGNLFVPFFTTKAGGSGIGLVLGRQIAEAHGGSLDLDNREDAPGCRATLTLPIGPS
jgi:signal transduction histidine kinase